MRSIELRTRADGGDPWLIRAPFHSMQKHCAPMSGLALTLAMLLGAIDMLPGADDAPKSAIKPLTEEQQGRLLKERLDGGMSYSFVQFANMFFVKSRLDLGLCIGLMTPSKDVAKATLTSSFPEFYKPTLREFLDAIALQTFSCWKYDPTDRYLEKKKGVSLDDVAIFEFTPIEREKPYEVTLAKGWKPVDRGNWTMFVPPTFAVGMDIYEMGTYSSDEKNHEKQLLARVPVEVSMEWARRVKKEAAQKDLQPAKVGAYDALFFESMIPSQSGAPVRWRQWVFMVDAKCYFVVSTIFPDRESTIFPDVEAMLKSFKPKTQQGGLTPAPSNAGNPR